MTSILVRLIRQALPAVFTAIWNDGYDHGVTDAEAGTTSY